MPERLKGISNGKLQNSNLMPGRALHNLLIQRDKEKTFTQVAHTSRRSLSGCLRRKDSSILDMDKIG